MKNVFFYKYNKLCIAFKIWRTNINQNNIWIKQENNIYAYKIKTQGAYIKYYKLLIQWKVWAEYN